MTPWERYCNWCISLGECKYVRLYSGLLSLSNKTTGISASGLLHSKLYLTALESGELLFHTGCFDKLKLQQYHLFPTTAKHLPLTKTDLLHILINLGKKETIYI